MVETQRMDITRSAPEIYRHLREIEQVIARKIDPKLYHLIKLRASQINGCAYCLGMHTDEALRDGETPERLMLLDAWHESSKFSEKERAALEWVEALTLITEGHVPDAVYQQARKHFSEKELVDLTVAAVAINSWNRLAIAVRATPQLQVAKAAA